MTKMLVALQCLYVEPENKPGNFQIHVLPILMKMYIIFYPAIPVNLVQLSLVTRTTPFATQKVVLYKAGGLMIKVHFKFIQNGQL